MAAPVYPASCLNCSGRSISWLVTSACEPFGMVIAQAIACGTAVISGHRGRATLLLGETELSDWRMPSSRDARSSEESARWCRKSTELADAPANTVVRGWSSSFRSRSGVTGSGRSSIELWTDVDPTGNRGLPGGSTPRTQGTGRIRGRLPKAGLGSSLVATRERDIERYG